MFTRAEVLLSVTVQTNLSTPNSFVCELNRCFYLFLSSSPLGRSDLNAVLLVKKRL